MITLNKENTNSTAPPLDGHNWELPIPFNSVTLPTFPIHCLPPVLCDYVAAVSEATQTPLDMAAVAALAVMAVCAQGKYAVQGKPDWLEPLNLYAVIVANPAERKSAILSRLGRTDRATD